MMAFGFGIGFIELAIIGAAVLLLIGGVVTLVIALGGRGRDDR